MLHELEGDTATGGAPATKQKPIHTMTAVSEDVKDVIDAAKEIVPAKPDTVAVNADEDLQKKLITLQAQQTAIEGNIVHLQKSCSDALTNQKGDHLARKLNSCLNLTETCEMQLAAINREIQSLLTSDQLPAEMTSAFNFSMQVEDFKAEVHQHQMQYFTANPQSVAKPVGMVIAPKPHESYDKFAKLPPVEMPTFSGDYTHVDVISGHVRCAYRTEEGHGRDHKAVLSERGITG